MCAEMCNKIRCGRYKVEMPPATDRRYSECARMLKRMLEWDSKCAQLVAERDRLDHLAYKCWNMRQDNEEINCAAALDSFRERKRIVCGWLSLMNAEYSRRYSGMFRRFTEVCGPRLNHRAAMQYYLGLAGFENWDAVNERYRNVMQYPPYLLAAWLHHRADRINSRPI